MLCASKEDLSVRLCRSLSDLQVLKKLDETYANLLKTPLDQSKREKLEKKKWKKKKMVRHK